MNTIDNIIAIAEEYRTAESAMFRQALRTAIEQALKLEPVQRWAVFCGGCRKEWSVPYQHPGKSICAECEAKCKANTQQHAFARAIEAKLKDKNHGLR